MSKNFEEKINALGFVLNNRLNKKSINLFKNTVKDLKEENETNISTYFLKNLIDVKNAHTKTIKVSKVLKRCEFKTMFVNSYNKEFDNIGNTIKSKKRLSFIIA